MNSIFVAFDNQNSLITTSAKEISHSIVSPRIQQFADGEIRVVLDDPTVFVDKTVVLVQSTSNPVQENIFRIALLAHELKNAQAKKIIGVLPYFGYARQEASNIKGKPGPAVVVARMLEVAGIDEIITVELHTPKIKSFFSIPIHNVILNDFFAQHIQKQFDSLADVCLVAPDEGARERVEAIAQKLNVGTIVFAKERYGIDKTRVLGKSGLCQGKVAIIIDDIIDTGGTALHVCDELTAIGFEKVYGYFVHPVFSGDTLNKIKASQFTHIFVANTIDVPHVSEYEKVSVLDVSSQLSTLIKKIL